MNTIGSNIGSVDFLRNASMTNTAPVKAEKQEAQISEPSDKMEFSSSKDTDNSFIVTAKSKENLSQVKAKILSEHPGSKITADLDIINGFTVELAKDDKQELGIMPGLRGLDGDINVWKDGRISIPEPIMQPMEADTRMDVAPVTLGVDKLREAGITGKGTTICVIDTGIAQHPDLKDRIIGFKDFVNGRDTAYDDQGHGTHCTGIAAGSGEAKGGKYIGCAPEASIVGVKVLDKNGSGSFSNIIKGIQWAIENKEKYGINVISMSLGGQITAPAAEDPVSLAAEKAVEAGIITMVAAGNSGPWEGTIGTPGNAETVMTVGAMDDRGTEDRSDDTLAYFSSIGPTTFDNRVKPDIIAPGVNITAASHLGSGYVSKSGTSMATPFAAGVMALAAQVKPDVKPLELKEIVKGTATPLASKPGLDENHQGKGCLEPLTIINTLNPDLHIG